MTQLYAAKIDNILGHKTSLNRFLKIRVIQSIFSAQSEIKLEIITERYLEKSPNIWKLNNIILNNCGSKKKSTGKLECILN